MVQQGRVIVGAYSASVDRSVRKQIRGSFWSTVNFRYLGMVLFSVLVHGALIWYTGRIPLSKTEIVEIEKVPERFARLIIDKPIPRGQTVSEFMKKTVEEKKTAEIKTEVSPQEKAAPMTRAQAREAVAQRQVRVEESVRNVGVLGMLTGTGTTAKGPSVADVLGSIDAGKKQFRSLDDALQNVRGLKKVEKVDILDQKLVRSKDVSVSHRETIDNLVAGVSSGKTADLTRRGEFVIQRPESIEGAASSDAKRDQAAINEVVASHRASIRMSYNRQLQRNPALSGIITIRFTISASGDVVSVIVVSNTTESRDLEQDITRRVRMWKFEPIDEGDVTVTYPFVFSPAG